MKNKSGELDPMFVTLYDMGRYDLAIGSLIANVLMDYQDFKEEPANEANK
jgi:hypothetical protein